MNGLGLVGYGYDDDDDDEEEEEDDALADALNRDKERPNGTAERPLSSMPLERDRTDEGGASGQAADSEQQTTQNGAVAMTNGVQAPDGTTLGEATPTGGDVPMLEHSPNIQQAPDEEEPFVIPTAPPWSVPGIPDAPEHKCDDKWQNRIVWVLEQQKRTGKQMVTEMQSNKTYRNPRFMEKDIAEKAVFQYGTCFPPEVWDPRGLPDEDFLVGARGVRTKMRQLDRAKRAKAAASSANVGKVATQRMHPASMPASAARASAALNSGTKRSKWDQTR